MATLLTLGESMGVAATSPGTPLRSATHLRLSTAGAEATVAVGMRRLGHDAAWVGTVGADDVGHRIIGDLRSEGVDTRFVRTVADAPSGFMLRNHRTPDYVDVAYYRAGLAGARLAPADVEAAFDGLDHVDFVHFTGITPMLSATCRAAIERTLELAAQRHAVVSFDVNHRRAVATADHAGRDARELVARTDILFVGDDELHLLCDDEDSASAARSLAQLGPGEVIVKRGSQGACAATSVGDLTHVEAMEVTVADVIGAGDSFVAGYLAARAHGQDIAGRLRWATICAACTVGTHGDWEGLPTRADIEARTRVGHTNR